jgi:hypothetical protein
VFGSNYADKSISIPYHMIAISLVSFVIPMGIGVYVKHKKPEMADRIQSLLSRSDSGNNLIKKTAIFFVKISKDISRPI